MYTIYLGSRGMMRSLGRWRIRIFGGGMRIARGDKRRDEQD